MKTISLILCILGFATIAHAEKCGPENGFELRTEKGQSLFCDADVDCLGIQAGAAFDAVHLRFNEKATKTLEEYTNIHHNKLSEVVCGRIVASPTFKTKIDSGILNLSNLQKADLECLQKKVKACQK
jgi:hypothetical protein